METAVPDNPVQQVTDTKKQFLEDLRFIAWQCRDDTMVDSFLKKLRGLTIKYHQPIVIIMEDTVAKNKDVVSIQGDGSVFVQPGCSRLSAAKAKKNAREPELDDAEGCRMFVVLFHAIRALLGDTLPFFRFSFDLD